MNKVAIACILGLTALASCKEIVTQPALTPSTPSTDTNYMATVETPQPRVIAIEEATGMHCSNCPAGAAAIAGIIQANPDRVVAVGMHYGSFAENFEFSDVDFRSDAARDLFSFFGGEPGGKPAAIIDRIPKDGDIYLFSTSTWISQANARLAVATPANVSLTSVWNEGDSTAQVTVRVAFTQAQTRPVKLTVGMTESDIIAPQLNGVNTDSAYTHKHVLRDMLTLASGQQLMNGQPIEAGRVYQRTFTYKPNAAWKPEHCELYAIVHHGDQQGLEVLQAAQTELK